MQLLNYIQKFSLWFLNLKTTEILILSERDINIKYDEELIPGSQENSRLHLYLLFTLRSILPRFFSLKFVCLRNQ
jgi:hypothetical protein